MTLLLIVLFSLTGVVVGALFPGPVLAATAALANWIKSWGTKK